MFNQNDFFLVSNTGLLQSFSLIKSNNLFHSDVQKTNAMSANATKPKMTKVHLWDDTVPFIYQEFSNHIPVDWNIISSNFVRDANNGEF